MIKVFTGPMYSAKSNSLIEEYNKIWDKARVICFKPSKDTRDFSKLYSRDNKETIKAKVIKDISEIKDNLEENTSTVFIDEVQFLTGNAAEILYISIHNNIDFYIAGLNLTSELKPFGIMPDILAIADEVVHLKACCAECNKRNAIYTYCLVDKQDDVLIGSNQYQPICSSCLQKKLIFAKK